MDNFQDALTSYQQAYQIREKLKLTDDMAQSLQNLAEVNVDLGQYDTAVTQYLKALEIARNSNDLSGIAVNSSGLGALFTEQGKYAAALSALQESLKDFDQSKDQSWLMVEAKGRYGNALSEVGNWDEGQKSLDEAVKQAAEVKNDSVLAANLNYLGDSYFYRGDYSAARQQYDKALQVANKDKSRQLLAVTRFNMARLDVVQNRTAAAIPVLKKLVEESDTLGLKALSVQSSVYLAQALLASKNTADAQRGIRAGHESRRETRFAGGAGQGPLPHGRTPEQRAERPRSTPRSIRKRLESSSRSARKTVQAGCWTAPT